MNEPPTGQLLVDSNTVKRSAVQLKRSADAVEASADRNTELAAARTLLASERTYAAWVRTSLAALASGVGARALIPDVVPSWLVCSTGSVLIVFSAFCLVAAVWRGREASVPPPDPGLARLPVWLLLLTNGSLMLVALAALIGIWVYEP
jgi:putative membrane protein